MDANEIQLFGANARARGESYFDNPYLKTEALPAYSGLSVQEWSRRHDLWELGWRMEDAMRA